MNVLAAMEDTMKLADTQIQSFTLNCQDCSVSRQIDYDHLCEMRIKMRTTEMSYGKQNRWLGWIQATIVTWGKSTLEDMKEINKRHTDDRE